MTPSEATTAFVKEAMDRGCIVEAGWRSMHAIAFPNGTLPEQYDMLREAFFGGAQHLFGSLMSALDADEEPTSEDMDRMNKIDEELKEFIKEYATKHGIPWRK